MTANGHKSEYLARRDGVRRNNNGRENIDTCNDDNGCSCVGEVSNILRQQLDWVSVTGVLSSRIANSSHRQQQQRQLQQRRQPTGQHKKSSATTITATNFTNNNNDNINNNNRLRLFGKFIIQSGECNRRVAQHLQAQSSGELLPFGRVQRQPAQALIVGLRWWATFGLAFMAISVMMMASVDCSPMVVDGGDNQTEVYTDDNCNKFRFGSGRSQSELRADRMLMILKCDIIPVINNYELLYKTAGSKAHKSIEGAKMIELRDKVNEMWPMVLKAMSMREFCTYPTLEIFVKLRDLMVGQGKGFEVLEIMYDVMAIGLHTNCLVKALKNLPKIPNLVRNTVDIYVDGADRKPLDLNEVPNMLANQRLEELEFDAKEAIQRNGPIGLVVGLSLGVTLGSDLGESEREFRRKCHNFLTEIDERWQSMEIMNSMLSTETNSIQTYNNYMMHLIISLRYADICSQLTKV